MLVSGRQLADQKPGAKKWRNPKAAKRARRLALEQAKKKGPRA